MCNFVWFQVVLMRKNFLGHQADEIITQNWERKSRIVRKEGFQSLECMKLTVSNSQL